jgi:epoxyqueuosine reductase
MMLTHEQIKTFALENGADLVGIGSMDRFAGTVPEKDPRFIAPRAKSIIGLGFRVLRGAVRGVEEGTHFYQLPEMGIVHIDEVHAPTVIRRVACLLEDHGFEGVVQRSVPDRRRGDDPGTNPEQVSTFKIRYSDAVAPDRPAPDVLMDFNQAARICGLGEIGLGGFFLTPRFGPFQRFAFILTDAELAADPVAETTLCDRCGACIAACPGQALSDAGDLDEWQCAAYRMGADAKGNPFLDPEAVRAMPDGAEVLAGAKRFDEAAIERWKPLWNEAYPQVRFGYNPALCGLACQRACLAHLEKRGLLKDKFANHFRRE